MKKEGITNVSICLNAFEHKMTIQRYAKNSIKSYLNCFKFLLYYFYPKTPKTISVDELEQYIHHKIEKDRISSSLQKQLLGSIVLYYSLCENKKINLNANNF